MWSFVSALVSLRAFRGRCLSIGSLLLLSCAAASGTSGAAAGPADASISPLMVATSDSGKLQIEVRTTPDQPPTRGVSTFTLDVSDAETGAPQDGLTLQVVPWMPAMGHGTSVKPATEPMGNGTYVVSRVNFYMGGKWDLRTSISGALTDHVALHFSIR